MNMHVDVDNTNDKFFWNDVSINSAWISDSFALLPALAELVDVK